MKKYDFIIAGGGMAGLSLAYYLSQSPLSDRSILILDRDSKDRNDRTWCFWEQGAGPFESIVFRKWRTVDFHGTTYAGPIDMGDYQYKMLRGIDFYDFMREKLSAHSNIEFQQATINRIKDTPQGGFVIANDEPYIADYVFDSTFALKMNQPENHNLLQHFRGWVIRTEKPCFDPDRPRIMDFRVEQHGDCRFVYVLPFDERTALVEFTLFNDKLLTEEDYENVLRRYIEQHIDTGTIIQGQEWLKDTGPVDEYIDTRTYQISEVETGVIPMTDEPTQENPSDHIVRIGTAGGYTKASTGYTFQRTQRYLRAIVDNLVATGRPNRQTTWFSRRFKLYDSVFLNVLEKHRHPADDVFTRVYVENPHRVFKFLDEDTRLPEELKLFTTMPWWPFTSAFFDVLRRRWFG
ncbi:lycopene cyclase [Fibrisoma montanum]|uniref:Lycopene cyclase n=1 Tax=Fibrisoma montanum TaxID=2305895 RepID=A0A418M009_9BACT|nr:lycopene cyclase family protein [Fibrisoma montanum]RIV18970.1 lycopene cyclase [Fibrisoma montanum]